MAMRRTHQKSKLGCTQCKLRRVKCDEGRPLCSGCARREIECVYQVERSAKRTPPIGPSASQARGGGHDGLAHVETGAGVGVSPTSGPRRAKAGAKPALNVKDLELLHHYTTVTYLSLSTAAMDHKELWQVHMVHMALENEYLLRGILAISAMHLAFLRPERRDYYAEQASEHQSLAIRSFHSALAHVDGGNCHAVFAFSCLVVLIAFAVSAPSPGNDVPDARRTMLNWIYLVRGTESVLASHVGELAGGTLAPLLRDILPLDISAAEASPDDGRIASLVELCDSPALQEEAGTREAYDVTISNLRESYREASYLAKKGSDNITPIFSWPIHVPQAYLNFLVEGRPEAMIIFAYYATLVHRLDNQWYLQ
ncbi:MAG: hypothetical protein M1838_004332, partial [Thelocarpon superellum]